MSLDTLTLYFIIFQYQPKETIQPDINLLNDVLLHLLIKKKIKTNFHARPLID